MQSGGDQELQSSKINILFLFSIHKYENNSSLISIKKQKQNIYKKYRNFFFAVSVS